jgi:hypothetical protein
MDLAPIYYYPIWAVGLVFIAILTTTLELSFRIGLKNREAWKDADSGGGAVVLTSMFALMGLVLAFTYSIGVNHYDANKKAVIMEANALSTAFLKANLVAEPGRTELKTKLLEYARTRTFRWGAYITNEERKIALRITLDQQAELWLATTHVVDQGDRGPISSSLVSAINDAIDAHTIRLAAILDKLPRVVIWMLLFLAAASLGVAGYNAGIQGRMSRFRMTALTLVIGCLMLIILDFDRPGDGFIIADDSSIDNVIADMEADLGQ